MWVTWRDLLPTKRKCRDQRIVTTTATVSPCPDFVEWEMTVPHIFPQIITARRLYHTVTSYQIWLLEWPTPPDYWSREFKDFILVTTNWHTHLAWVCNVSQIPTVLCACLFQREKLQEKESFGNSAGRQWLSLAQSWILTTKLPPQLLTSVFHVLPIDEQRTAS